MKTIINMNNKILILSALTIPLLIMGAGCTSSSTTTPVIVPTDSTSDSSSTPITSTDNKTPITQSDGTRILVAAETDETWVLYANKALGYTVNTPTKGKYTPTWEMKYVDQSDSHIINGCYFEINPTSKNEAVSDTVVVTDGTKFCHTKSEFGDSPSLFVVDGYTTVIGNKFIVIKFTKVATEVNAFVGSDYQKTLDGIMGTFLMNTASKPE